MNELETDMALAMDLYKSIKVNRRCRNYQHKKIRLAKSERNKLADVTKLYVSKVKILKDERDHCNIMVQEFKQLRNDAIINLRSAKKTGNKVSHIRFDKVQIEMHDEMVEKATQSQECQIKIEEINLSILKTSEQCGGKQQEINILFNKAESFHEKVVIDIRAVEMIKKKHGIDFIEHGGEEE